MPTFRITSPDGSVFDVSAPEGATEQDALDRVRQQHAAPSGSTLEGARPVDDRGDFVRGFDSGVDNMQGMAYGFAALLGDSVGHKGLRDWGMEGYERNQQEAAKNAPRVNSYRDIQNVGDFFDYAQGVIGQTAPFSLTTIAGGGIGGLLTRAIAPRLLAQKIGEETAKQAVARILKDKVAKDALSKVVNKWALRGAGAGSFAASAATQQGDVYGQLKEAGVDDAIVPAWTYGALMGALDVAPEALLAKTLLSPSQVAKDLSKSFARGIAGKAAKTVGTQTVAEGLTEGAQEALAVLARAQSDENFNWDDKANERILDNVVAGAVAGLFMGGGGATIEGLKAKWTEEKQNAPKPDAGKKPAATITTPRVEIPAESAGAAAPAETPAAPAPAGPAPAAGAPAAVVPSGGEAVSGEPAAAAAPVAAAAPAAEPAASADTTAPAGVIPAQPRYDRFGGSIPPEIQARAQEQLRNPPPVDPRFIVGGAPEQESAPAPDAPSVEPIGDLRAQLRDTRNPTRARRATYLSAPNVEAHGEAIKPQANGLVAVENADDNGGVLYAKAPDAKEFVERKQAGEDPQALIGEFTGADPLGLGGKPQTAAPLVVQRTDESGAVVQQSVVDGRDADVGVKTVQAVSQEPGDVSVITPEEALARREAEADPPLTDEIADLDREIAQAVADSRMAGHINGLRQMRSELQAEARERAAARSTIAESGLFQELSPEDLTGWLNRYGNTIIDQSEDSEDALRLRTQFLEWMNSNRPTRQQRAAYKEWKKSAAQFDLGLSPAEDTLLTQIRDELPSAYRAKALEWIGAKRARISEILQAKRARNMTLAAVVARVLELSHDVATATVYRRSKQNAAQRDKRNAAARNQRAVEQNIQDDEQVPENRLTGWEIGQPAFVVGKGLNVSDGVIDGQILVGEGRVRAAPWVGEDAEDRAMNAAALRQLQDPDATYVAEQIDDNQADRLGLPRGGWYVMAYPRVSAEMHYSKVAGGRRTPAALTRLFIANAKRRYRAIPPDVKESREPGAPVYGLHVGVYKDGEIVETAVLASDEIVKLGMELEPSLRHRGTNLKHRLEAALRVGIAAIMDFDDRGKRMRVTALEPGSKGLPANLILRQAGPGGRQILLRDAVGKQKLISSGVYTSRSARGRTNATIADPAPAQTPVDTPAFDRAGMAGGGFATNDPVPVMQQAAVNPETDEFIPYQIGEDGNVVEATRENTPDVRQFEPEEAQNRRSTMEIDPTDSVGGSDKRKGDSAIGTVGGSTERPTVARNADGTVDIRSAAPNPARDNKTWTAIYDDKLNMVMADVVETMHGLLKIAANVVVTDNINDAIKLARLRGGDPNVIQQAWDAMLARGAGGVVRRSGGTHYILLDTSRPQEAVFKTMAHEMGHAFYNEVHDSMPVELRSALAEAYRRFMDSPQGQELARRHPQRYPIEEWMADQVAAWTYTDKKPRTALERLFHSLATSLTKIYEYMRGRGYKLDATAQLFIQYAIADGPRTLQPSFDSLGSANDMSFDMNIEPAEAPRHTRDAWAWARGLRAKYPTVDKFATFMRDAMLGAHNVLTARVFKRVERMNNENFNKIMAMFYKGVGADLKKAEQDAGTFFSDIDGYMQYFTGRYREITDGLTEAQKTALMNEALLERDLDPNFPHAKQLFEMRKMLREIGDYMVKAGLPIKLIDNYFTQVYDKEALADPDAVREILNALNQNKVVNPDTKQEYTPDEVRQILADMLDDNFSVNVDPEHAASEANYAAPFAQALRMRVLPPEFRNAVRSVVDFKTGKAKYMAKSLDQVVGTYIRQSIRRAEFNRRLGDPDFVTRLAQWEGRDESRANEPKPIFRPFRVLNELVASSGGTPDEQKFMHEVVSAMLGEYGRITSPALRKLTNSMMLYQNLRTLLFVTFSSFPDMANIFIRTGDFKSTFRVMRENAKAALKGDLNSTLRAYGHAADALDSTLMADLVNWRDVDGKLWKINEKWFRAIQLHRWTNFTRGLGLKVSQDYIVRHAQQAVAGNVDSQRRLDELGISAEDVRIWADPEGNAQNSAWSSPLDADPSVMRVTKALQRMVNDMVIHPTPPEKTLWGNAEHFKLVWHLKSFMYGFQTRVLGRVWHELSRDGATTAQQAVAVGGLMLLLPLAAFGLMLRDLFQYWLPGAMGFGDGKSYTPYDDPLKYLWTLAGRSGVTGTGQMAIDTLQAASRGRAPMLALAGPTVTQMNDFLEYPLYKTVPGSIPILSSIPGVRDVLRDTLKPD